MTPFVIVMFVGSCWLLIRSYRLMVEAEKQAGDALALLELANRYRMDGTAAWDRARELFPEQ